MITVSKVQGKAREFLNLIHNSSFETKDIYAIAIARKLADHLVLPSSKVDSPSAVYNQSNAYKANDYINTLNELMVLDTRKLYELTRSFWMMRYAMAFPGSEESGSCSADPVACLLGYEYYIAPALIERIKTVTNMEDILSGVGLIVDVVVASDGE